MNIENGVLYGVNEKDIEFLNSNPKKFWGSATQIDRYAFANIGSLKEIVIPPQIRVVRFRAFKGCMNLRKVVIEGYETASPRALYLEDHCFMGCKKLESFEIKNRKSVNLGTNCFSDCSRLKEFSAEYLKECSFIDCEGLTKLKVDDFIYGDAVYNLQSLKELSCGRLLGKNAINKCPQLESVIITGREFDLSAFSECPKINSVYISKHIKRVYAEEKNAKFLGENIEFNLCETADKSGEYYVLKPNAYAPKNRIIFSGLNTKYSLSALPFLLRFKDDRKFCEEILEKQFKTNMSSLTTEAVKKLMATRDEKLLRYVFRNLDLNGISMYEKKYFVSMLEYLKDKETVDLLYLFHPKLKNIGGFSRVLLFEIFTDKSKEEYIKFVEETDFKWLEVFDKQISKMKNNDGESLFSIQGLVRMLYAFGICGENGQQVANYCLRLAEEFPKFIEMSYNFVDLELNGENREYFKYINSQPNYFIIQEIERKNMSNSSTNYLVYLYNNYNAIATASSSDKGSNRQIVPTIESAILYKNAKETGKKINEKYKDIYLEILKYWGSTKQDIAKIVKEAIKVRKRKELLKIPDHILSFHLTNELFEKVANDRVDIFENTEKNLKVACIISTLTKNELNTLQNNALSFEFLSKDSAENFTVGKKCSCCAHFQGAGSPIVYETFLNRDVQNLVIRKNGIIIAKSTITVNRLKGYAICNNVEVNEKYLCEKKEEIYDKYKLALKLFAEAYNLENPHKKLKAITVGQGNNDLCWEITTASDFIRDEVNIKKYTRKPFSNYKLINRDTYGGDSKYRQWFMWKKEEEKI